MHHRKSYYVVVRQLFMMMNAHQKYILPFYRIAMHGTVRAIQGVLPRFPRVLPFLALVSELTSPWLASMAPMVTEPLSRFIIQRLVLEKVQLALPPGIQTTEVPVDALYRERPGRNKMSARQVQQSYGWQGLFL